MPADVAEVIFYTEDSVSPLTVLKPAAFGAGQMLVVVIAQDSDVASDLTAPAGWTEGANRVDISNQHAKVWYHAYDVSDPSSWGFGYGPTSSIAAAVIRVTGADVDLPVVVVPAPTTSTSNTATVNSPSVTPTGGDDLLIVTLSTNGNAAAFSSVDPSGTTDQSQIQNLGVNEGIAVASEQLVSGSATGVLPWTSVSPTGRAVGAFSVAVKSAGLFDPDPPSPGQAFLMPPWLMRELVLSRRLPTRGDIGAPQVREVLSAGASNATATVVTGPNTADGDLLVAFHGNNFYTAAGMLTPTGTAGTWTQRAVGDNGTNAAHMKVWTRPVVGGGPQTVTCAPVIDEEISLQLFVLSGADIVTPADDAAGGNGAATTAPVAPSVTAAATGDLLLCGVQNVNLGDFTAPPQMVKRSEVDTITICTAATASSEIGGPGATGTRTFTDSVSSAYASASILIRPAGGTAGASTINGTATIAGAGALTTPAVQGVIAAAAGAGVLIAPVTLGAASSSAGAGVLAATAVQQATTSPAGAGVLTSAVVQQATATLSGAGVLTATTVATINGTAALAGAGVLSATVTQGVTATLTGAGVLTASVVQRAAASPTGAGTVTAAATQSAGATPAGAGVVSALATQQATAAPTGAGVLSATGTASGGATAALTGVGVLTAAATQGAGATITGAGILAAAVVQNGKTSPTGAGTLAAAGVIAGTATLAGAGTLTSAVRQLAGTSLAGAGVLSATSSAAAINGTASLVGAGVLTISGDPCVTVRPFGGVTTYPLATTARPSSGTTVYVTATTARPNTGQTDDPC